MLFDHNWYIYSSTIAKNLHNMINKIKEKCQITIYCIVPKSNWVKKLTELNNYGAAVAGIRRGQILAADIGLRWQWILSRVDIGVATGIGQRTIRAVEV